MNRDEERKLIVGLLSDLDPRLVQEGSLRRALGTVRTENRRRRLVRFAPLLCAPLLLGLGLLLRLGRESNPATPLAQAPRTTLESTAWSSPGVEPIDDAQLLTLLAGRTVALIGPPGRERLLVFDAPRPVP